MNVSHRVTQFNCGQPLRDHTPSEPIHPYLHEVNIDASLIRGMIKSTSGDNKDGAIKEGEEFLPLTQSTQLIESSDNSPAPRKTVRIPAHVEHEGFYLVSITLDWICPVCGGPRGEVYDTRSYDGGRIAYCDGWINPCGHVDKYADVRDEASAPTTPAASCACGHLLTDHDEPHGCERCDCEYTPAAVTASEVGNG